MAIHNKSHAMSSTTDHSAGNWKLFYSNGSGEVIELAVGATGTCLVSGGAAAAPIWSTLLGETVVNCAGATPLTTDFTALAEGSHGFAVGTGGRVWVFYKSSAGVFATEITSVPAE